MWLVVRGFPGNRRARRLCHPTWSSLRNAVAQAKGVLKPKRVLVADLVLTVSEQDTLAVEIEKRGGDRKTVAVGPVKIGDVYIWPVCIGDSDG